MSTGEALVRVGAPVAVALLLTVALLVGRSGPDRDLQLIAPDGAVAGRPVALRALLLEGVDRPQGPRLATAPVRVRLVDRTGRVLGRTRLVPSKVAGMEGSLAVPAGLRGTYGLRAQVTLGSRVSRVHVPLVVGPRVPAERSRGRLASPLQQYVPFEVRPEGNAVPPKPFDARVLGGGCVPEVPCRLLVWVGSPPAAVRIERTPAVEPAGPATEAGPFVSFTIVVHGPEAELHLVATRDGEPVARRTVRLPVTQAVPSLRIGEMLPKAPASPVLHVAGLDPRAAVIVDGFREGHWERAGSGRVRADGTLPLPFARLDPGIWRLQVRTDPFTAEDAAARMLVVRGAGQTEGAAVQTFARWLQSRNADDPLARAILAGRAPVGAPPELLSRFLAAGAELRLIAQPTARSGYVQHQVGAEATIEGWRVVMALAVLCIGLLVAAYLWWRGVRAAREAARILAEDGDAPVASRSGMWVAVGVAVVVLTVFAGVALFIIGRGAW